MNLQMEGGSPGTHPTKDTFFYGRNIYVGRTNKLKLIKLFNCDKN